MLIEGLSREKNGEAELASKEGETQGRKNGGVMRGGVSGMMSVVYTGRVSEQRMGPRSGVRKRAGANQGKCLSLITHQNL